MRDFDRLLRDRIADAIAVHGALQRETAGAAAAARAIVATYLAGGKALFFGNGGSAADAQHLVAELTGRYGMDREALPGLALTVNTSSLTAIANDYGYTRIFARQIEASGEPGDVAVGLSTSGRSDNVLEALRVARSRGLTTVLLTGEDPGPMGAEVDHCVCVPSRETPRIQEAHILIGHTFCEAVERVVFTPITVDTVFVDRDGVINRRMPDGRYVTRWDQFEWMPGAAEGLARLSAMGRRIVVVTNQRGVARGVLSRGDLDDIHARMVAALIEAHVSIAGVYVCPHDEGACDCRKPQAGLLLQAQADCPEIDFSRAAIIGDALADIEAGARVGTHTILVGDRVTLRAGVDEAGRRRIPIDRTAPSLADAVARYLVAG